MRRLEIDFLSTSRLIQGKLCEVLLSKDLLQETRSHLITVHLRTRWKLKFSNWKSPGQMRII